jgi:predicted dehydrogenase
LVTNEAAPTGYEAEDRHFVRAFLGPKPPRLTFDDGVDVVALMAAYQSAEQERTLTFPPEGLDAFVPAVARGAWRG